MFSYSLGQKYPLILTFKDTSLMITAIVNLYFFSVFFLETGSKVLKLWENIRCNKPQDAQSGVHLGYTTVMHGVQLLLLLILLLILKSSHLSSERIRYLLGKSVREKRKERERKRKRVVKKDKGDNRKQQKLKGGKKACPFLAFKL